jgi:malonyl-CoA O-methyltransferase
MNPNLEICKAFNSHAFEYEKSAKVQHEIGVRLDARLDYLKIKPRTILDLGCGPSVFSKRLKARYPGATIVGLDMAYNMLMLSKTK